MPDTIAAIATIQAPSAIGIVRLTGPDTRRILDGVFAPANGRPMSAQTPRKLVFGRALDRSGGVIDEALAVLFPGPNSYTGEDCAEIHCHGSPSCSTRCSPPPLPAVRGRRAAANSPSAPFSAGGWTSFRRSPWPTSSTPRAPGRRATPSVSCRGA